MVAFPVLCAAALIVAVRVGLREASRDESDLAGVMPRVRVHRGRRAGLLAQAAHAAHVGFVALGVASLLVMLLSLAAALAR